MTTFVDFEGSQIYSYSLPVLYFTSLKMSSTACACEITQLSSSQVFNLSQALKVCTYSMRQNKVPVVVPYYWRSTLKCKNSSFRLVFSNWLHL